MSYQMWLTLNPMSRMNREWRAPKDRLPKSRKKLNKKKLYSYPCSALSDQSSPLLSGGGLLEHGIPEY